MNCSTLSRGLLPTKLTAARYPVMNAEPIFWKWIKNSVYAWFARKQMSGKLCHAISESVNCCSDRFIFKLFQDPVPHHGTELFSSDLKPSVASLQATVMSNATLAAAAAYQSQLGLATARAGVTPMADQQASSSLTHHHHHGDAALLHDYHSLWQWVAGYGYSQWEY